MANNRRKARKDTYLSKRGAKNKKFLMAAGSLLVVSSLGFAYLNSSMNKEHADMNKDIISSQKKLDDVKNEIEGLKEDYEMRNTDEFKEKVAKERLGMVKKGEESSEENSVVKPVENIDKEDNLKASEENPANVEKQENQEGQANGQSHEATSPNGEKTTENADGR